VPLLNLNKVPPPRDSASDEQPFEAILQIVTGRLGSADKELAGDALQDMEMSFSGRRADSEEHPEGMDQFELSGISEHKDDKLTQS